MKTFEYIISEKKINCTFDVPSDFITSNFNKEKSVIITDDKVFSFHQHKFVGFKVITISNGERFKTQTTIDNVIKQLLEWKISKEDTIIGVGGGVVTDIAGFVANIYKRGINLVLFPTTILGMVDAALGGKNGINVGLYKNMVGTVYQPAIIAFDFAFLASLPDVEWVNGFAEIIKHACIQDEILFSVLEKSSILEYKNNPKLIAALIENNVSLKMNFVIKDEFDRKERKFLNFGHTLGHALENLYQLPHGHAVSIGMVAAARLSEKINIQTGSISERIVRLLKLYELPVDMEFNYKEVFDLMQLDKKREGDYLNFVLLNKIGEAFTQPLEMGIIEECLKEMHS